MQQYLELMAGELKKQITQANVNQATYKKQKLTELPDVNKPQLGFDGKTTRIVCLGPFLDLIESVLTFPRE